MDKAQAIHEFWSGFNLPAYDENSVPNNALTPYITYNVSTDSIGNMVVLNGSLWYTATSWQAISEKADEIAARIGYGYAIKKIDGGYMWITKGTPFAQRMRDENPYIKRIYIILHAEFLTAY